MGRKGMNIGSWPVLIVTAVISVVAVGLAIGTIYSITDSAKSVDREALNKLGKKTQEMCDMALREASPQDQETVSGLKFRNVEEVSVNQAGAGEAVYKATFSDKEPLKYEIHGCDVALKGRDSIPSGTWEATLETGNAGKTIMVRVEEG